MPLRQPLPSLLSLPRAKLALTSREVVDENNTPLCLLAEESILNQGLRHRAVALLIRDHAGRLLLRPQPDACWGFSSFALPLPGEASEDCARRLLAEEWKLPELAPRPICRVDACAETGMAFLTLFEARISSTQATALATPGKACPDGLPLVDAIELAGLADQEPPLLSPLLLEAVRSGWLKKKEEN